MALANFSAKQQERRKNTQELLGVFSSIMFSLVAFVYSKNALNTPDNSGCSISLSVSISSVFKTMFHLHAPNDKNMQSLVCVH